MKISDILRERNFGFIKIFSVHTYDETIEEILSKFGLLPNKDALFEVNEVIAANIIKSILWKDLAYGVEIMTEEIALVRANFIVDLFNDGFVKYYTNGRWDSYHTSRAIRPASGPGTPLRGAHAHPRYIYHEASVLKRVMLILVVILSLLGAVAYYFVFFELNRTKEAVIGLYLKNDNFVKNQFDYALYESTLETRFKEWTNYQDLVRYVESLDGECTPSGTGDSVCRFYMSERFCYVIWISVKVKVDNGKIRKISTEKEEDGC